MKYSKLELFPGHSSKEKTENPLFTILLFNRQSLDFNFYMKNLFDQVTVFSKNTYEIYFFDFNSETDFSSYFKSRWDNLHIFLFDNDVFPDYFDVYRYFESDFKSEYLFFLDTDYFIATIDIPGVLKLFTDKNVGGITFPVKRDFGIIEDYRYKPKTEDSPKSGLIFEVEPVKPLCMTAFPVDTLFFTKKEIIQQWSNFPSRILKGFLDPKKKSRLFIKKYLCFQKMNFGFFSLSNKQFFILANLAEIKDNSGNGIKDKIVLDHNSFFGFYLYYTYFDSFKENKLIFFVYLLWFKLKYKIRKKELGELKTVFNQNFLTTNKKFLKKSFLEYIKKIYEVY